MVAKQKPDNHYVKYARITVLIQRKPVVSYILRNESAQGVHF